MIEILKALSLENINSDFSVYENKKEKYYEYTFDYFTEKQFDNYEKQIKKMNRNKSPEEKIEIKVVGNATLKKRFILENYEDSEFNKIILLEMNLLDETKEAVDNTYFEVTEPNKDASILGYSYIRVDDYSYVRIVQSWLGFFLQLWNNKKLLLKIILGVLLTVAFLFLLKNYTENNYLPWENHNRDIVSSVERETNVSDFTGLEAREEQEGAVEYGTVAGYANLLVYEEAKDIELINLPNSNFYVKYEVYLGDDDMFDNHSLFNPSTSKKLFETNLIEAGKVVKWNAFDELEAGNNKIVLVLSTYDAIINETGELDVGEKGNGVTQFVEIECRK